jgi:hypothetical protein
MYCFQLLLSISTCADASWREFTSNPFLESSDSCLHVTLLAGPILVDNFDHVTNRVSPNVRSLVP